MARQRYVVAHHTQIYANALDAAAALLIAVRKLGMAKQESDMGKVRSADTLATEAAEYIDKARAALDAMNE